MCKIDGVLAENATQYSHQFGIEKKLVRRIRKNALEEILKLFP